MSSGASLGCNVDDEGQEKYEDDEQQQFCQCLSAEESERTQQEQLGRFRAYWHEDEGLQKVELYVSMGGIGLQGSKKKKNKLNKLI